MLGEIFGFVSNIIKPITELIDDLVTTDEEKLELNARIKQIENEFKAKALSHEAEIVKAQASIIKAEVQGDLWIQKAWRPILMLSIVFIVVNNYILFPYISLLTDKVKILDLPTGLWTLMTVGVGGYIGSRGLEKIKGTR